MRAHRLAASLLIAAACGCGGTQSTAVEQKSSGDVKSNPATPLIPVLAKEHLADAAAEAKKWRPDASLVQVAGRPISDGKANWWEYGAWSPSAKTCLVITFIRDRVNTQESGGAMCESAPLGEIIDSDQALKIARDNGLTKEDVSMVAMASPSRRAASTWSVIEEGMRNPGNIMLDIDAATGKVLNTTRTP